MASRRSSNVLFNIKTDDQIWDEIPALTPNRDEVFRRRKEAYKAELTAALIQSETELSGPPASASTSSSQLQLYQYRKPSGETGFVAERITPTPSKDTRILSNFA